jgi:hypothetical protein
MEDEVSTKSVTENVAEACVVQEYSIYRVRGEFCG